MMETGERKNKPSEVHWVINALFKNGKLQLEERTEPGTSLFGYIIVPGGVIERGELPDEASLREINEEYGIIPKKYRKIGEVNNEGHTGTKYYRHVFLVTEWEGELSNREGRNKHVEMTIDEAREFCKHPTTQQILDLVETELFRQD